MPFHDLSGFERDHDPRGEEEADAPGRVGRSRHFTPRWPASRYDVPASRWRSPAVVRALASVDRAPRLSEDTARLYFWPRVDKTSGPHHHLRGRCWLWTGKPGRGGYGYVSIHGVTTGAHRYALEVTTGPIGDLFACHLCDVPMCCNPAHLYPGDPQSNADDARHAREQKMAEQLTGEVL